MKPIRDWFHRTFSDPQVLLLTIVLGLAVAAIVFVADMVAPVIAALVVAFLLDAPVEFLKRQGVRHIVAVSAVFVAFVAASALFLGGLLPILVRQSLEFAERVPQIVAVLRDGLLRLPQLFPGVVTVDGVQSLLGDLGASLTNLFRALPSLAGASVVGLLSAIVYLILVLLLIFFMIKDKARLLAWVAGYLPRERSLTTTVWREVNDQVANYVRGKFWEILIVGVVTYVVFALLGVEFSILLAVITGLSVLIPYVGAAAVTVPVALIGFVQWGPTWDFAWVLIAYGVIQALDGNVLAPLLFSEVVDLHPIAIIMAILFFGGLWGFWGVFFAIPLATVVQAVLRAWPRRAV